MTYTKMAHQTLNGRWSWSVLDDQRTSVISGADHPTQAEAEAKADEALVKTLLDKPEPTAHQNSACWRDYFDGHNTHTRTTGMPIACFGQSMTADQLDAMINGAKASSHKDAMHQDIERWQRLRATYLDPNDGRRADGEPLC